MTVAWHLQPYWGEMRTLSVKNLGNRLETVTNMLHAMTEPCYLISGLMLTVKLGKPGATATNKKSE